MRIARSGADFENSVPDIEYGNVEGTAAEIEYQNRLICFLVESVGKRSRSRLIDDPEHVKTGDFAGISGRLSLRIIEVCRDCYYRVRNFLAQVLSGILSQFSQHLGGNCLRRILLPHDQEPHGVV